MSMFENPVGNISKSKGFKGDKGDKGDTPNIYFRVDADGNLYYSTEYVPSLKTAPYVGENGNWYAFDGMTKRFKDTGYSAMGDLPKDYINDYINETINDSIASQTAILRNDIESLNDHITRSAHFKGYFATNEEVKSCLATPNDFAYSAESRTVWVFDDMGDEQYAWADSGVEVPDQLTPASDALPLINGEADAGKMNEYARSDHRHPHDTTRVSVEEFEELKAYVESKPDFFEVSVTSMGHLPEYQDVIDANKTYAEIMQACQDGKFVIVRLNYSRFFYCYDLGFNDIKFVSTFANISQTLTCTEDDTWSIKTHYLSLEEPITKTYINNAINTATPGIVDAVIEALPDADTMSFPLEEAVSEVSEE